MAYTTINKPSEYFNTKLYTQTGSTNNGDTQTITMDNVGMVWIKNRSYTNAHALFDIVRGGNGAYCLLSTNSTGGGQGSDIDSAEGLTFGSSTTTIGTDGGGYGYNNRTGDNYVAWHWRTDGTTGSSNTDGSKTSTVSANQTSGFSVVKWVGVDGTVGHGLNAVPEMIIVKNTDDSTHWFVYHKSIGNSKFLTLNETGVEQTNAGVWNATSPTSSVFTVGSQLNNANYIAYVFAPKKGFSKFGFYEGNGNADGTFVYTGFKPAFVLYKAKGAVQSWNMHDNKRLGYNPNNAFLFPNLTQAESNITRIDLLSNGFKLRTTDAGQNGSGQGYIYMAFAENPLVGTNGVPATAR
jgi:hypothetical protein